MADRKLSNTICHVNAQDKQAAFTYYPILVIGSGESGIALGCRLKEKLGFDQFRIFERQSGIGGTWWINRYPGVACDVPAVFYSFSFSPNHRWSSFYPGGPEIVEYFQHVCDKYQLNDKIQFNTDVTEIRWREDEELWEVRLTHLLPGLGDLSSKEREKRAKEQGRERVFLTQEVVKAKIVVSAAGGVVEPNQLPDSIAGREQFVGKVFHSARWDPDVDLNEKNIVVLGTGCSAAQFVPLLTKAPFNAKSVTQVMRSPPWVVPRITPLFGQDKWEKWTPALFERIPLLARAARLLIFLLAEYDFSRHFHDTPYNRKARKETESQMMHYMKKSVPEKYHEILSPNYPIGCKRRVFNEKWFSSLHDSKLKLITQPLTSLHARGATLGPGRDYPDPKESASKVSTDQVEIPADVIILANGFEIGNWLHPLKVRGKGGALMQDVWDERGGAQAYMGVTMDGFPNFFMIFGPNTATGHTSVILASENMVEYSLKFIRHILNDDVKTVEVKKEAEVAWTQEIHEQLDRTVFNFGGCSNWYKNKNGWNSTVYPYSQFDYTIRCMFPRWSHYHLRYTTKGLVKKWAWRFLSVGLVIFVLMGMVRVRQEGLSLTMVPGILLQYCRRTVVRGLHALARKI